MLDESHYIKNPRAKRTQAVRRLAESLEPNALRMALTGAAPLPPELATSVMDEWGDILFNGYASTEVGSGTLATPTDLRAAPGTVGRPMTGVTIRILDEEGLELPVGENVRLDSLENAKAVERRVQFIDLFVLREHAVAREPARVEGGL